MAADASSRKEAKAMKSMLSEARESARLLAEFDSGIETEAGAVSFGAMCEMLRQAEFEEVQIEAVAKRSIREAGESRA